MQYNYVSSFIFIEGNLSGNGKNKIYDNVLHLNCAHYLPVSGEAIPTGEIRSVSGEPFDFTKPTVLKDQMLQISGGGKPGIDHCFVVSGALDSSGHYQYESSHYRDYLRFAGQMTDNQSGRTISVHTTQPGMQVYTANFLPDDACRHPFTVHNAFCFETQHFPDAPNKPNFPSVTLRPGEIYHHHTVYSFGVNK
jgi:aldose 1-epimerase